MHLHRVGECPCSLMRQIGPCLPLQATHGRQVIGCRCVHYLVLVSRQAQRPTHGAGLGSLAVAEGRRQCTSVQRPCPYRSKLIPNPNHAWQKVTGCTTSRTSTRPWAAGHSTAIDPSRPSRSLPCLLVSHLPVLFHRNATGSTEHERVCTTRTAFRK